MSQYNKLSDIQYARIHILPVDLHFETVLVSYYPHRTQRKGESIHFGATISTVVGGCQFRFLLMENLPRKIEASFEEGQFSMKQKPRRFNGHPRCRHKIRQLS